jgi:hypothetical protein
MVTGHWTKAQFGRTTKFATSFATLLEEDQSRLGEVYRALQRGRDAGAIAAELEIGTSSFVWNYERIIKTVLDGNLLPSAPTVALGAARRYRSILKSRSSIPSSTLLPRNQPSRAGAPGR